MWRTLGAGVLCLVLAGAAVAQPDPDRIARIDEFVAAELARSGAPGLAYAVVETGAVHAAGFGARRAGGDEPVTPDTLFRIGSVSKSFTALAILQLAEAGLIDLDAPASAYLYGFAAAAQDDVTVRRLLTHTSGYSTLQGNAPPAAEPGAEATLAVAASALARSGPARSPGTGWAYSNANYQLLGAIIEAVTGRPYADYLQTEIFDPAGMTNSFVATDAPPGAMATGHRLGFLGRRASPETWGGWHAAPAGGIVSNAQDMGRYLAVMLNGEDDLISAEGKASMLRPGDPSSPFYGLGWYVDAETGQAFHAGLTPGFEAMAFLAPEEGVGVVVLVNASSGLGFGDIAPLLTGPPALALGEAYVRGGGQISQRILVLGLGLLPVTFLGGLVVACLRQAGLRAKTRSAFGLFSLWFPVAAIGAMSWALLWATPRAFGTPLATLGLYQPGFVLILKASVLTGAAWVLLRLGLAYFSSVGAGRAQDS